mmetsp:Transcript_24782/g.98392  ORF Transcript_24782/g.98392 Transcript_24782/m.98392 type:complete len:272 (-) Transcript_24782:906-1721(-)
MLDDLCGRRSVVRVEGEQFRQNGAAPRSNEPRDARVGGSSALEVAERDGALKVGREVAAELVDEDAEREEVGAAQVVDAAAAPPLRGDVELVAVGRVARRGGRRIVGGAREAEVADGPRGLVVVVFASEAAVREAPEDVARGEVEVRVAARVDVREAPRDVARGAPRRGGAPRRASTVCGRRRIIIRRGGPLLRPRGLAEPAAQRLAAELHLHAEPSGGSPRRCSAAGRGGRRGGLIVGGGRRDVVVVVVVVGAMRCDAMPRARGPGLPTN